MPAGAQTWKTSLLWLAAAACAWPGLSPPVALLAGLGFAVLLGNPDARRTALVQKWLLQGSVVGLGFGIQIGAVMRAGATGLVATAVSLVATLAAGAWLARRLGVERTTGRLISTGTAICGGSAIAAVGPVVGAEARTMSVALGCVFLLNAVALFLFPVVGHAVGLSPEQFGHWAAIAIHDTSSVVGAAARYAPEALMVAVPLKLARALWILPLVAWVAWRERRAGARLSVPWFVGWFIAASLLASLWPGGESIFPWLVQAGRSGLGVTLFLIGVGLSKENLRTMGWRPFLFGTCLWVGISGVSLAAILIFY